MKSQALLSLICLGSNTFGALLGIPTVPFRVSNGGGSFNLRGVHSILVDDNHAESKDSSGWTLIPPTLNDFAATFAEDLRHVTGRGLTIGHDRQCRENAIFLTVGNNTEFVDAAGRWTSEGHSIVANSSGITITGASPLGAWWGTRTILQQAALNEGRMRYGTGVDSPGWGTRGIFLDAARHYYPPSFITEICNWISFYKQNTFHLHLSDNIYNNVDRYSREQQLELYSAFRLWSDDPAVAGLNKRRNESYTRDEFEDMQKRCAARGVTIVPEIEAPGHALVISQWKPELGLNGQLDLLNISNPGTIPSMKTIWSTFLPWMKSKVVHIGADEYDSPDLSKAELAASYNTFVNALDSFISKISGKSIRIWGTFPPQANYSNNIPTNVAIQHWEFFEDNPYYDYLKKGYSVINSDDAFYIVTKYSTSYPQDLNRSRIFHGDPSVPGGGPYAPNIFDTKNSSNNPERSHPGVLGHIAAQWNDYGYNTSTYLEAYYSWASNLPALADKQWGGRLTEQDYGQIYDKLQAAAPAQNLDRRIASKGDEILHYNFGEKPKGYGRDGSVRDQSGNSYDGHTNCDQTDSVIHFKKPCSLTTPLTSKGFDYTLSFTLNQLYKQPGPLFTGPDSSLHSGNGTSPQIMLISGNNAYPLNYTLPVGKWVRATLIGRGNQTFFSVDGGKELEFLATIGVNGERIEKARMAIVAPLKTVGGGAWEGEMKEIKLIGRA